MAQYYQVLSQNEKTTVENLRQYYPNIIENQTVQYVISPEDQQQQFQTQQILVSSDQVMVIENPPQHVIVDQSAVTYQNPQYLVQETSGDYQSQNQPVYYMEEVDSSRQVQVNQQIPQPTPPIVLNHQLQSTIHNELTITNNSPKSNVAVRPPPPLHQIQQPRAPQVPIRHNLVQVRAPNHQTHLSLVSQRPQVVQQPPRPSLQLPQNQQNPRNVTPQHQIQIPSQNETVNHPTVTLRDGQIVNLTEYQKPRTATPESLEKSVLNKFKSSQHLKSPRGTRGGRSKARRNMSAPNNTVSYSTPDATPQRFLTQQLKHINQNQQKQFAPHQIHAVMQPQPAIKQHPQVLQQQQPIQHQIHQAQYVQPQYLIQPPSQHQLHQRTPLPAYIASSQIQQIIDSTPVGEEYSDSIRMLVMLENGEQRLITFTLPKEACTIQEILEQVGVPFHPDTKIECTETNNCGINYVVVVGAQGQEGNLSQEGEVQEQIPKVDSSEEQHKSSSPESPDLEAPHYIPGLLAVCNHCGYTSENFRRCLRCRYKLPDDVKTRPALNSIGANGKKPDVLKTLPHVHEKKLSPKTSANRKKKSKVIDPEPVVLTLSSDDEESQSTSVSETDEIIRKLNNSSVTLSAIKKEPSTNDIKQNTSENEPSYAVKDDNADNQNLITTLSCRTIRIGSYKCFPSGEVLLKSQELVLRVPVPNDPNTVKKLVIEKKNVVKVLVNFNKSLPVVFYYVDEMVGEYIREELGMVEGGDRYFDPLSSEESFKRITLLLDIVPEATKGIMRTIYDFNKPNKIIDELTSYEANDILLKTCPKELSKVIASSGYHDIKPLFIYPPGKGGLSINTEDYLCLAQDQFLNDVIIDFYLKYLVLNLPEVLQQKVHVFSTFFYKRLTTKPVKASRRTHPAELDPVLTPAQKRHARVEKWTKSVNLFEKDFIIIPINENCHWFLAIVCFPGMTGCITWDGNTISVSPKQKKKKKLSTTTIGNVTITTVGKEKIPEFDDCDASDKDEAEGDESELDSDIDSDESETLQLSQTPISNKRQPIKQASILIFDSLAGASRARVVATLRDYLSCEYKAKMGVDKVFNKDVIKGSCPKVPQQTNFTDCGLYLLQYVESFFKTPIKDYHVPIKEVTHWFDEFVVTKKREDISLLIKDLMLKYDKDLDILPVISFPTLDGKLVQRDEEDEEFMNDELEEELEEEDYLPEDSSEVSDSHNDSTETHAEQQIEDESPAAVTTPITNPIRINLNNSKRKEEQQEPVANKGRDGFIEEAISDQFLKPDMSETGSSSSSRETLSYLKAKRINRHKSLSTIDTKRFKSSDD
ncbi:uncharacterized protein LOC116172807 isoform X2 [Photinus pyralis]|uniref:uncharacterized protein LOC116172807 isoform X2 n=1 Tax=Photinus pyralis TaxID=7054 RepID=UPI00126710B8|nr:uncharacterized protein LOC116172807 isoform X2 [Photinus pyralis]